MEDMRLSIPVPIPSTTSSFLTPDYARTRERRLSTCSNTDSCISHASSTSRSRRSSKRGGSRNNSELDDDSDDVTLLSLIQRTRTIVHSIYATSRRLLVRALRKSRPSPKLVCEGEILEQTNMILRDYVLHKLNAKDLVSRKLALTAADWPQSSYVIDACLALEHAYPRTYSNVSRKLCMTMTSTKVVRIALNSVLDVLFEGPMTWGKVVSMCSICGLFAEECAMQGHVDFASVVIDVVIDFTNSRLIEWLVGQGGWDCFPCPQDDDGLCDNMRRVFAVTFAGSTVALSSTFAVLYWIQDGGP